MAYFHSELIKTDALCHKNNLPSFQNDSPITFLVIQIKLKGDKCVIYPDSIVKRKRIHVTQFRNGS
jgi:hypothetical protein